MELDTGAGMSVISQTDYEKKYFQLVNLKEADLKLNSYSGEEIHINGLISCAVILNG